MNVRCLIRYVAATGTMACFSLALFAQKQSVDIADLPKKLAPSLSPQFSNMEHATRSKQATANAAFSMSLSINIDAAILPDSVSLWIRPVPDELESNPQDIHTSVSKNNIKWGFQSTKPISVNVSFVKPDNQYVFWMLEPGDDISINVIESKLFFSGPGSEKLSLANKIYAAMESVEKPANPVEFVALSEREFRDYNTYLNEQLALIDPIFELYKGKVTDYSINYLKATVIYEIERKRFLRFYSLYAHNVIRSFTPVMTNDQLCNIFDSCFFQKPAVWMRKQPFYFIGANDCFGLARLQVMRKLNFPGPFFQRDYIVDIFEEGKKLYNGLALEHFLATAMLNLVVDKIGFTPETEKILDKYYNELSLPVYRVYVKQEERKFGKLYIGKDAPLFNLTAINGRVFNNKSLLDKVVILNFCMSENDCSKCAYNSSLVERLRPESKRDTNLAIFNIISPAQFKRNPPRNKIEYIVADSSLLKSFGMYDCAGMRLIGPRGKIMADSDSIGTEQKLRNLVEKNLHEIWENHQDGPYVLRENSKMKICNIKNNEPEVNDSNATELMVHTDIRDHYFSVRLKSGVNIEPAAYKMPSKLLAISDIEGNFGALRNLLQANKVIDEEFNWIFGDGHLVLAGDIVDRGNQVTECLWLIYSLEEKAKASGGYVHFILGNHEIMNLSGDLRYVHEKYKRNAQKLNKIYSSDLYGNYTELGKWLRSKNIIEKIGECLFVHAGISEEVNNLSLSVDQLNEIAKPYYDRDSVARKLGEKKVSLIYHSQLSPFWYREYYRTDSVKRYLGADGIIPVFKTPVKVIDEVLSSFQVKKIVTGHTIFKGSVGEHGKYITTHYDSKVINIDTKHADGYSEALLIEDDKFYRVNTEGKKVLLFDN